MIVRSKHFLPGWKTDYEKPIYRLPPKKWNNTMNRLKKKMLLYILNALYCNKFCFNL